MHDLDDFGKEMESCFGLISGYMVYGLHEEATAAGSQWDINNDDTIDIPVNKNNAYSVYELCKEIRSGYNVNVSKKLMAAVKKARLESHLFLVKEANDPNTSIDRKIELVRLTSKNNQQ